MARPTPLQRAGMHWLFGLASALLLLFLVGPLLAVLLADPGAAAAALGDAELLRAVGVSFGCAALATLLAVLLGTPLAFLLARHEFPAKRLVRALLALPLVIPHPVAGIALLLVFARSRLLGSILEGRLGVEIVGAAPGVVLAMLFVSAPLVVKGVEEGFFGIDPRLERVSRSLGATPRLTFLRVSLPLVRPALVGAALSGFARAVSEFGSIAVLAYFPRTAPVLIWDRFSAYGLRGALPATAFLLLVSLFVFLAWSAADGRSRRAAR